MPSFSQTPPPKAAAIIEEDADDWENERDIDKPALTSEKSKNTLAPKAETMKTSETTENKPTQPADKKPTDENKDEKLDKPEAGTGAAFVSPMITTGVVGPLPPGILRKKKPTPEDTSGN